MFKGIMVYFSDNTHNRFELDDNHISEFTQWIENAENEHFKIVYDGCTYYLLKNSIKYMELFK